MKTVIAIPQMGTDLFRKYMKGKYVKSLERGGADVKWLEHDDIEKAIAEAMECDGLLLPGGADIEPALYGRERQEKCGKPNELRDRAEFSLYLAFVKTGKPILCICRGFQLLNVINGGTLYQDISEIKKCNHSDFLKRAKAIHSVAVTEDTKLHAIFGRKEFGVNSLHHQAVETVGEGLTVGAESEDGFIEALELTGHPFCLGVQWHPEHMSKKDALQQQLFNEFVKACKKV
ncbi:MAG: gamma-glutamyl-gamma-aminobutyrate hydrolase family protein [Ruminococcaceae bacterium]|nr:gamma-glutamyl-gamma-aminobutyrate hydrolase family protein [Oscillospiraceae bacterium]